MTPVGSTANSIPKTLIVFICYLHTLVPLATKQLGVPKAVPEPKTCLWKRRVLSVSRKQH